MPYHFCMHHNNGLGAWVIHNPNKRIRRESHKERCPLTKVMSLTKVLQAIQGKTGDLLSDEDEWGLGQNTVMFAYVLPTGSLHGPTLGTTWHSGRQSQ